MAPVQVAWDRLVRYVSATDNQIRYGEPILDPTEVENVAQLATEGKLQVKILEGTEPISAQRTDKVDKVKTLLGPIEPKNTPIFRCIGLNYKSHILEASRTLPPYPTTFTKPSHSAADHGEDIPIPAFAIKKLDYEGELAFVIGKDCKNVKEEDALDFIAGYTATNDVSARDWQRDPELAGLVPQWTFGKSLDKFAPLGPVLVAAHVLGAADTLSLKTFVNDELRQQGNTSDLCFGARQIIAFLSKGTTLQKGTVIMTGTPGGVGLFMKPPNFIKHGDTVSVWVEKIGTLSNRYVVVDE
ncbi:hypothetical protein FB567DRAFT_601391 [Paraphoma chrysanthemicola]|uniref:Fumarylacetoacetase-like C-terminal domain-containing protein n=1 Tax=Paraphoma chrysanthemicola TaxID=798071 RepID=A0A8K0RKI5_9PLEO|nr:hypothetical protein FB567DRAFT_601391 [Paraphoma chrysanthemicola]